MPAAGNPLSQLTAPTVGTPINFNSANIVPGSTYNGISLNGGSVTFPAGTYIVSGGNFTLKGNATVTGTGVTFYFTNGATLDASGGGSSMDIQMSAPNSGTYAGILFYQDSNDTSSPQLGGDNSSKFQGTLYFPTAQLTFFGNDTFNAGATYTIVIAGAVALSGHPDVVINSNYSGLPGGLSIIKNATLME